MLKYLNRVTTASERGLFDYLPNDRTRNNGAKLIVKHFNTTVAQHFYPIKITTTWNALPNEVITSRTVNSFKNGFDKHWGENLQMLELTCSNHRCRAQFKKCAQTVVGQRFAGNGPNGLSYDYYAYYYYYYYAYYYYYILLLLLLYTTTTTTITTIYYYYYYYYYYYILLLYTTTTTTFITITTTYPDH